jgi:hypothetical protein
MSQTHSSVGIPSPVLVQGSDSLNAPLLKLGPPSRFVLKPTRPASLEPDDTLLGFGAPSAYLGSWSPRPHSLAVRRPNPFQIGSLLMGPKPSTTGSFAGFLNLSMILFLLLPAHHFQMGNALGVMPFRGFHLLQKLPDSSSETCPHDFSPNSCATFDLGKGPAGHVCYDPGSKI